MKLREFVKFNSGFKCGECGFNQHGEERKLINLLNKSEHQKKVIDRLSRKIQKFNREVRWLRLRYYLQLRLKEYSYDVIEKAILILKELLYQLDNRFIDQIDIEQYIKNTINTLEGKDE